MGDDHPTAEAGNETRPAARALPNGLAVALVTVTSGSVLVLEILAGRLLAPYVGVNLETYTAIIGTILAGIAIAHAPSKRQRQAITQSSSAP